MTHQDIQIAAALRLIQDGAEICAIIAQSVADKAARGGRPVEQSDYSAAIELLLTASWQIAQHACDDRRAASEAYVALLRRHANTVEKAGAD